MHQVLALVSSSAIQHCSIEFGGLRVCPPPILAPAETVVHINNSFFFF
jgi:hypothetical protein